MSKSNKRNISIVMIITIISKCLGFVRDMVLANYYGTSDVTDAFFVSQTIPEFLFSLVVQAISVGFIPIFMLIKENGGKEKANTFTNNILKLCILLSVALIVVVNIFAQEIVFIFASGFQGDKAALTIEFTRIIVFSMVFRITVSVYSAFLNANGSFVKPALNGVVLDIVSIISIVISSVTKSTVLVYGIIFATFLQFVMLFTSVIEEKPLISISLKNIIDDDVKKIIRMLLPVVLGVGSSQINVLADRTMASAIPGAISSLNYANKTNNVVENIIILSLATVVFPLFSKNIAKNDRVSFKHNVQKSFDVVSFCMIPCAFFFFACSKEIISVVFARGAFGFNEIESTSIAMKYYSMGLVSLSYNIILTRALYALKKVSTVSCISCFSVALNILFNFFLKPLMGIGGLALATSISTVAATFPLILCLQKETGRLHFLRKSEFLKSLLSSASMIIVVLTVKRLFSVDSAILSLIISVILSGSMYFITQLLQKSAVLNEGMKLLKNLRRHKPG